MDITDRFASLVSRPSAEVPLDEVALCIAACADPDVDVEHETARLDELAAACSARSLDALCRHLFVDLGFRGNRQDYYDPRNSYLNEVVDRKLGIPISLAVVAIAVGRRVGVPLVGVGMPGHFLVRDEVDLTAFVDPFAGGLVLDRDGCEARFHAVHGMNAPFRESYLQPVDSSAIVVRMLNNLASIFARQGSRADLVWVHRLRTLMPDASHEEHARLAAALAGDGRLVEAADLLDRLGAIDHEVGSSYAESGRRIRSRMN